MPTEAQEGIANEFNEEFNAVETLSPRVVAIRVDLPALMDLVADPETVLDARIPHGDGQTILREALLVADHNAYHLGQLVFLRRCLGA